MGFSKDRFFQRFKWQVTFVCVAGVAIVLLAIFTDVFLGLETSMILWPLRSMVTLAFLGAAGLLSMKVVKMLDVLSESGATLEKISEELEKQRTELKKINQSLCLSETAKAIAYRDMEKQSLREVVLDKLAQQDFEGTTKMIEEMGGYAGYEELAEQLRVEASQYRDSNEHERINQVISHIRRLFEVHQWAKASVHIERLIKSYPDDDEVKGLRRELVEKREERKKELLKIWNEAVQRGDTDGSLEILQELDMYLTPNEGLALQEAARDVFRTKLHNMGVQFALAVSEKQWGKALETGRSITREFPNSRMAEEIREKWDALKQRVREQTK